MRAGPLWPVAAPSRIYIFSLYYYARCLFFEIENQIPQIQHPRTRKWQKKKKQTKTFLTTSQREVGYQGRGAFFCFRQ